MPEALFTCLLVLGTVALLQGLRSARLVWYAYRAAPSGRGGTYAVRIAQLVVVLAARAARRPSAARHLATHARGRSSPRQGDHALGGDGLRRVRDRLDRDTWRAVDLPHRASRSRFRLPDALLDPYPERDRNEARRTVIEMAG